MTEFGQIYRKENNMRKIFSIFFLIFTAVLPVFSQFNGFSPIGANTAQDLFSPALAGRGSFTTSKGPAAGALNPAAEGNSQRMMFNFGYLGISGFGKENGLGNAFSFGVVVPAKIGVFGGSFSMIQSPFTSFPVQTSFMFNLNAAKELYPGMNFGLGLNLGYSTAGHPIISADFGSATISSSRFVPLIIKASLSPVFMP